MKRLLIALLLIPTVTGFITEMGPDYIEIVGDGTLLIGTEPLNISGITILTISSFDYENLSCPSIALSHEHYEAYANATLNLTFNGETHAISTPRTEPEMSLNKCSDCSDYYPAARTPCTIPSCSMLIETESLQNERISYRVIADEPYTYWIEDAFATIVKNPAQSSSTAKKSYTPPSGIAERVFLLRAENACASATSYVGFIEAIEDTCEQARIETDALHTTTISYRIIAEEAYTYWVEDAWGEIVKAASESTTDDPKSYTPPAHPGERVFVLYANTSCGVSTRAVGITEPIEAIEACEQLTIVTDAVSDGAITYKIHADEPYTYWIEDAYGTILREPTVSSMSTPKSYTPRSDEHVIVIYANTSCATATQAVAYRAPLAESVLCPTPLISAEPIQSERIRYRITSETPYAYSIENLTHSLRTDTSTTDTVKQYTPTPNKPEQLYIIRAENECGEENLTIGFVSDTDHCPEPELGIVCSEQFARIDELESQLDENTKPQQMTSFYTLARTAAESYVFRSSARSNATFFACAARTVERDGDALTIRFADEELINATPVLVALENGSILDTRIANVPTFVGNRSSDPESPDPDPDSPDHSDPDDSEPSEPDAPVEPPVVAPPAEPPEPLRADPIRRAVRRFINLIRTRRAVQSAEPWIMPVGIGLASLTLLMPTTPRRSE